MEPQELFKDYQQDSIVKLVEANAIETFVAMPFDENKEKVFQQVIEPAYKKACELMKDDRSMTRSLSVPKVVHVEGCGDIQANMLKQIMDKHIFLADITGHNANVFFELGLAMILKPNNQIIIIRNEPVNKKCGLPFDINTNNVIGYGCLDGYINELRITEIASAMIAAANAFDGNLKIYIEKEKMRLTPTAIKMLNQIGGQTRDCHKNNDNNGWKPEFITEETFKNDFSKECFQKAAQELLDKRLLVTDWKSEASGMHYYGMRLTKFGFYFFANAFKEYRCYISRMGMRKFEEEAFFDPNKEEGR